MSEFDSRQPQPTLALRLFVSSAVLRDWRLRGVGPRFCRFGRSVRYLTQEVERFIQSSAVPSAGTAVGDDADDEPRR